MSFSNQNQNFNALYYPFRYKPANAPTTTNYYIEGNDIINLYQPLTTTNYDESPITISSAYNGEYLTTNSSDINNLLQPINAPPPLFTRVSGIKPGYFANGNNLLCYFTPSLNTFIMNYTATVGITLVGGGGGGGQNIGGGGGGGGMAQFDYTFNAGDTIQLYVGSGGAGANYQGNDGLSGSAGDLTYINVKPNGSTSYIGIVYATGGGGGIGYSAGGIGGYVVIQNSIDLNTYINTGGGGSGGSYISNSTVSTTGGYYVRQNGYGQNITNYTNYGGLGTGTNGGNSYTSNGTTFVAGQYTVYAGGGGGGGGGVNPGYAGSGLGGNNGPANMNPPTSYNDAPSAPYGFTGNILYTGGGGAGSGGWNVNGGNRHPIAGNGADGIAIISWY